LTVWKLLSPLSLVCLPVSDVFLIHRGSLTLIAFELGRARFFLPDAVVPSLSTD